MQKKILKVKQSEAREITGAEKYDEWRDRNRKENPRANPDVLSESAGVWLTDEITKEVKGRVEKLMKLARQLLTIQQYKVFTYITEAMTRKEFRRVVATVTLRDDEYRALADCVEQQLPLTERQVALVMGISRGRVHQLWEAARLKMGKAYEQRTA